MRIDHARIAIRERSWLDNLDLALHVLRTQAKPLLLAALVGVLPALVMNVALISLLYGNSLDEDSTVDGMLLGTLLVMLEAPLATAAVTLYLGQSLFVERVDVRRIGRELLECLPQLLLFQGALRAVLILPVLTWIIPYGIWPYLNEVILLERNPLVAHNGQMSTMKRNSMLHRGGGDYLARGLFAGMISLLLVVALWTAQALIASFLLGLELGWLGTVITLQVALWTVAVYFTVARFLTYLDQRIRTEGWEVELALRAQRERLERQAA